MISKENYFNYSYDSTLILKKLKTLQTSHNFGQYSHKNAENTMKRNRIIYPTNREGGRTVGSGRVATIEA